MTADQLRLSIERLGDIQQRAYFFERLTNPALFGRLAEMGMFRQAPAARKEGDRTSFVVWPQAKYLINVADHIPDKVANALRDIRTDNALAAWDMMAAVLKLPTSYSKQLLPAMKQWFDSSPEMLIEQYVTMIRRFAEANDCDSALQLCDIALEVVPGRETRVDAISYRSVDADAKVGNTHYESILERIVYALLPVCALRIVGVLARKLEKALTIENRVKGKDLSSVWAANIKKKPIGHGAQEALTYFLHDSCDRAIKESISRLPQILEVLQSHPWDVFQRIRLLLIAEHGTIHDARTVLANPTFFSAHESERERGLVLRRFYPLLDDSEKTHAIEGLRAGLTSEERLRRFYAERLTGNDLEEAINRARHEEFFQELKPIASLLEGDIANEFSELNSRFGVEEPGPKNGEVWVGPTAPKPLDEFQKMSTAEILSFLETWIPTSGWFVPSPEGLGRTLKPIVAARIPEFLAARNRIITLAPIYVRHIVDAIRPHALSPDFDHAAFIELLDYARIADADQTKRKFAAWDKADEEQSWAPTRQIIAFAISDMLRVNAVALTLRSRIWGILESIVEDDDPTPEHDAEYTGGSSYGHPWNLALNSSRGAGMLAAFDYARWVYRSVKSDDAQIDLHDVAPELFDALDRRLNPAIDATRAIRSTFGQNFVSIYAMSRSWARASVDRIFSRDSRGEAAWNAYLVFNNVFGEIFDLLKDRYLDAVARVDSERSAKADEWYPAGALGTHLTGPFAWGRIDLYTGGMLDDFLKNAAPSALLQSLRSIGNALHSSDSIPESALHRFTLLFEYVLDLYEPRPIEHRREALGVFGLWFFSDRLNPQWGLKTLQRTLDLTGGEIDFDFRVLERLAVLCSAYPLETVTLLNRMIDTGQLFHFMNSESVRSILSSAVATGDAAYAVAVRINDRLSNAGVLNYRDVFAATS